MSTQEILTEILKLPLESQTQVLNSLARNIGQPPELRPPVSEDEVDQFLLAEGIISEIPSDLDEDFDAPINGEEGEPQTAVEPMTEEEFALHLLAKGIISEIPSGLNEEDDDFEPVEVSGEPVSETIIRERR